jgi:hypothetical protein
VLAPSPEITHGLHVSVDLTSYATQSIVSHCGEYDERPPTRGRRPGAAILQTCFGAWARSCQNRTVIRNSPPTVKRHLIRSHRAGEEQAQSYGEGPIDSELIWSMVSH